MKINGASKFWVTTSIAIIALVISIASVIVNEIRYIKNEQEAVYVTLTKAYSEYPTSTTTNHSGIYSSGLINTIWEVVISNIGKSPVSIIKYDLLTIHDSNILNYTDLDQGLFQTNQEKAQLPLNIQPGTSTKLYLKSGISLGPKASKLISEAPPDIKSQIMELSKYLAEKGRIDFFDNPVTPHLDGNKVIGFAVDSQVNDQIILISFKTAKNNIFGDKSRWYEFPQ
jgi:hypothetical protein